MFSNFLKKEITDQQYLCGYGHQICSYTLTVQDTVILDL